MLLDKPGDPCFGNIASHCTSFPLRGHTLAQSETISDLTARSLLDLIFVVLCPSSCCFICMLLIHVVALSVVLIASSVIVWELVRVYGNIHTFEIAECLPKQDGFCAASWRSGLRLESFIS